MALNEGIVVNDARSLMKSIMVKRLHELGPTTPNEWERAVFRELTDHDRDEVDWDFEDNQAGYYMWMRSFDDLVAELVDDGYVREQTSDGGKKLVPLDAEPSISYSYLNYPTP